MLVVIIADLVYGSIPLFTFAWIFIGIIIGYPFGRLTKISWNSDRLSSDKLDSEIGLLVAFIIIRIIPSIIIRMEFGYLSYVLDIVLLVSVGGTIGKTLGMVTQIRLALASNNPHHPLDIKIRMRINKATVFGFSYYFTNICILLGKKTIPPSYHKGKNVHIFSPLGNPFVIGSV